MEVTLEYNNSHPFSVVWYSSSSFAENPDRNPKRAVPYLQSACAANHAPSCFNLAVLYNKGDTGVEKSEKS